MKRALSLLLLLVMLATTYAPTLVSAAEEIQLPVFGTSARNEETVGGETSSESSDGNLDVQTVTRAAWLQALVETFDYSIEGGVVIDDYYTDLDPTAEYYKAVMTAVYYGLIDILPNEPLRPEEAATREFAAYTLNKCMGYLLEEGEAYTYTEAETVAYPDDIQIAINRGWFALSDGAFLPEQAVTVEEQAVMLADAEAYVASMTFDSEHYNDYKFLDDVIVIYSAAEVTADEETTELKFENLSKAVAAGDKFVIYQQGLAVPYRAVSVETEGTTTTITATELDFSEAIESMDVQTSVDASPENFYTAEDAELDFFNESTGEVYANAEAAIRAKKANPLAVIIPKFTTKVSVGGSTLSVSVELKNPKVFTDVSLGVTKASASIWLDTDAEITGKLTCEPEEALLEIPVGGYSIPGVGGLDIVVKFDISGSITVVQKCHMEVGVTVGYEVGFLSAKKTQSMIFKVKDKGSSINAEMSAKLYLEAKFGLYGKAMPIKGYFYGEVGFQANVKYTTYSEIEGNCVHFAAFLYAEYGIKVEYDLLIFENSLDWHQEPINEDNSPVKVSCHYEDGVHVASCTRKHLSGTTTGGYSGIGDSGYTTKSGSSYSGSGIGSKTSSSGYNSTGEPVIIYSYSLDEDGNATITKYSGNAVTLTIPQYLDGHPVVAIGDGAFKSKIGITTVILQDNIQRIGTNAFEGCQFLRSVTLSENLISIATGAFRNCTLLASIRIPDTVTDIGDHAFSGCRSLQYVSLSKNLVSLGGAAFEDCDALTSIKIPKSLDTTTKWHYNNLWGVFYNCDGLKTVTFEEGTTQIAEFLFANCPGLESIVIPDTVTVIEGRAFEACTNLTEVKLSSSLTSIHYSAFQNCNSLESVDIPDTVTDIGDHAFSGCGSLQNVSLSKGLISLGGAAFEDCDALESIEIPKSLDTTTKWHYNNLWGVFYNCDGLKTVTFEEGVTQIPIYLFANCPGLESVVIPDTVEVIEQDAFYNCINLQSVTIPNSVTEIHASAFKQTGLLTVTVPESVVSIGTSVFEGCPNLASVTWPSSLPIIPNVTFNGCTSLTEIILPDTLTTIGTGAFKNCDALTAFTMPDSVTTVNEEAFCDCDALVEIHLSTSLKSVPKNTFYNCDALASITIPYGVTSIGNSVFCDCDALETAVMPNTVTSMGTDVFAHCDVLKNVTLSQYLTKIPSGTFRDCAELEEIVIPYYATSIDANAFNSSSKLAKVIVRDNLTTINSTAFSYPEVTVFYGNAGSYAETWANENGYTFDTNTSSATSAILNETTLTVAKGKTAMLILSIDPADFADTISFKSSNTSVVTVDATGKITAVGVGSATVKVYVGDASASCKITVTQAVTRLRINKTTLALDVPATYQLTVTITPDDASNKTLLWTSSDESVATVDENGLVTAIDNGKVTITATTTDGSNLSVSCTVTVTDPNNIPASGITLDKTALTLDALDIYQLTATVKPDNAANKGIVWTSSNESVATVDENGVITAIAKGTATITATAADGYGASASCTVTVSNTAIIVTDATQLESAHPYPNNCKDLWFYRVEGAKRLVVLFDEQTVMEDGFDYLHVYDGAGTLIGTYTGEELAGKAIEVEGNAVKIRIDSDDTGNDWGFKVAFVQVIRCVHSYQATVTEPTCTESGYTTYVCSECGDTYTDNVTEPNGHTEHIERVEPTCTTDGLETKTCAVCGIALSDTVLPALGHEIESYGAKAPSCTEIGWDAYETCTRCDYTTYAELPATGHSYADGVCTVCGELECIYGDVNGDGKISGMDATRLLRYLAFFDPSTGESSLEITAGADTNGDGRINGMDVTRLLRYLAFFDPATGESKITLGP